MYEVHMYIETNCTSPRRMERWYGYVLEYEMQNGRPITRESFGRITGTYHQATLRAIDEALARLTKECELYIHTPDEFIVDMVENNLETWAECGFLSCRGLPVANQKEWMTFWEKSRSHFVFMICDKHPYSGWMRSEIERKEREYDTNQRSLGAG